MTRKISSLAMINQALEADKLPAKSVHVEL